MENGGDIAVLSKFIESLIITNNSVISLLFQKGIITKEELDAKTDELAKAMKEVSDLSAESARQGKPINLSNLSKILETKIWSK